MATARGELRSAMAGVLLLVAFTVPAQGQQGTPAGVPVLTLDAALALAIQGNVALANATLGVTKATASVGAARTRHLPSLILEAGANYSFNRQGFTVPAGEFGTYPIVGPIPDSSTTIQSIDGPYGAASASVTQPVLQLHRIGLMVNQFELEESLAEQELRGRRQEVVKQVRQQYYEMLKTQSALDAAVTSVAFYQALVALVQQYVEQEVAQEYEAMETRARLARSEYTVRRETNAFLTQQERFNNLLGRDPATRFRVEEQVPAPIGYPPLAQAESLAIAQRPDVQARGLRMQQAETGYRLTKSEYLPDLNVFMKYSQLVNVDFVPATDWSVGLQFRWDIYDWGRKSQELQKKRAEVSQAENELAHTKAEVSIEVAARLRDVTQAEELVKVTELTRQAATEKLRVLTNEYREQDALLKDVLQAESELADADNEYQRALLSFWTAQAELDKALGGT
jgi:outer membrane protein